MQRRLVGSQVGVWIDSRDGRLTVRQLAADVLKAKAAAHTTVRLRRDVIAACPFDRVLDSAACGPTKPGF
jgi:hypothetical protein